MFGIDSKWIQVVPNYGTLSFLTIRKKQQQYTQKQYSCPLFGQQVSNLWQRIIYINTYHIITSVPTRTEKYLTSDNKLNFRKFRELEFLPTLTQM